MAQVATSKAGQMQVEAVAVQPRRRTVALIFLTGLIALMIGGLALASGRTPAEITELHGVQAMTVVGGDVIYAGVRLEHPLRHEIYRSVNGGRTWKLVAAGLPSRVTALAAPMADGPLYVGTESMGVLKSMDGGKTWQPVNAGLGPMPNATITSLTVDPDSPNRLYASIGYWLGTGEAHFAPMGTYVSDDGGVSWTRLDAGAAP